MKLLDLTLRSQVAKECINRVCEAANLKTSKKRRCDKRIQQALSNKPDLTNAATDVTLRVSSKLLSLVNIENNEVIASHDMPKISFASGGDTVSISHAESIRKYWEPIRSLILFFWLHQWKYQETVDFVAYVAKNAEDWRACYVLECNGGQAGDLIAAIGQAFELRYNEFFNKSQ